MRSEKLDQAGLHCNLGLATSPDADFNRTRQPQRCGPVLRQSDSGIDKGRWLSLGRLRTSPLFLSLPPSLPDVNPPTLYQLPSCCA